eukprot:3213653-Pleurochrysis_carterae.AAC.6
MQGDGRLVAAGKLDKARCALLRRRPARPSPSLPTLCHLPSRALRKPMPERCLWCIRARPI